MAFITQGKANLKPRRRTFGSLRGKYILIVVILAMAVAGNANARALEARVIADYGQIRSEAEVIYGNENSYLNVNCDYGNIKVLCDDIEKYSGMKPIIHSSTTEYCAYGRTLKDLEFQGEYYGNYWCIDSELTSRQVRYLEPGSSGYCNGKTFRCPENDGVPSADLKAFFARENIKAKIINILVTFLLGVFLISGPTTLFWDYMRRKKGKKSSRLLKGIGITLSVISIILVILLYIESGVRY